MIIGSSFADSPRGRASVREIPAWRDMPSAFWIEGDRVWVRRQGVSTLVPRDDPIYMTMKGGGLADVTDATRAVVSYVKTTGCNVDVASYIRMAMSSKCLPLPQSLEMWRGVKMPYDGGVTQLTLEFVARQRWSVGVNKIVGIQRAFQGEAVLVNETILTNLAYRTERAVLPLTGFVYVVDHVEPRVLGDHYTQGMFVTEEGDGYPFLTDGSYVQDGVGKRLGAWVRCSEGAVWLGPADELIEFPGLYTTAIDRQFYDVADYDGDVVLVIDGVRYMMASAHRKKMSVGYRRGGQGARLPGHSKYFPMSLRPVESAVLPTSFRILKSAIGAVTFTDMADRLSHLGVLATSDQLVEWCGKSGVYVRGRSPGFEITPWKVDMEYEVPSDIHYATLMVGCGGTLRSGTPHVDTGWMDRPTRALTVLMGGILNKLTIVSVADELQATLSSSEWAGLGLYPFHLCRYAHADYLDLSCDPEAGSPQKPGWFAHSSPHAYYVLDVRRENEGHDAS